MTSKTTLKPISTPLSAKAYQALVVRAESRFPASLSWEELPLRRAGQRGRPRKDEPRVGLKPRTVKMPDQVWSALAQVAAEEGVSVNALLTAVTSDLLKRDSLPTSIRRLVRKGFLHSAKPSK